MFNKNFVMPLQNVSFFLRIAIFHNIWFCRICFNRSTNESYRARDLTLYKHIFRQQYDLYN